MRKHIDGKILWRNSWVPDSVLKGHTEERAAEADTGQMHMTSSDV